MISAILKYSIGSLMWGGLITVIFLSLYIFLIKGWYKDAVFRPVSFVVLGFLGVIILWNSTLICGALSMKSDIAAIHLLLDRATATLGLDGLERVDLQESNEVLQQAVDVHPILGYYANYCDFSGHTVAELPGVMCETLKDYLNKEILKCLLWTLGFVVVGSVIVIKTMDRGYARSRHASRPQTRTAREGRVSSRTSGRRKYSR